jgi:mono/diheme cytochrome c family protein
VLAALALGVLAGGAFATTPTTTTKTTTVAKTATMPGTASAGRKIFIEQQCGSCHLMAAANQLDGSGVGPDLDHVTATFAAMVKQITTGGHGMPAFKGALSTLQIEDLANFVWTTSNPPK